MDEDFASALLAADLGADLLVITIGVPQMAVGFGSASERRLDRMDTTQAARYLAGSEFPPGSMGPKVEAALRFLEAGGREALVTSPDRLAEALAGRTGTRIVSADRVVSGPREP